MQRLIANSHGFLYHGFHYNGETLINGILSPSADGVCILRTADSILSLLLLDCEYPEMVFSRVSVIINPEDGFESRLCYQPQVFIDGE